MRRRSRLPRKPVPATWSRSRSRTPLRTPTWSRDRFVEVRRTRSGDAWEARTAAPATGTAGVPLGMPAVGVPAPLPDAPVWADVAADAPTIPGDLRRLGPRRSGSAGASAATDLAVELSGVTGRAPRVTFLGTACGDNLRSPRFYAAAQRRGFAGSTCALFTMPNVDDVTAHLLEQDVVWVWGGSVAGLLAMWRLRWCRRTMRTAWEAGVVLTGVSAGSICWHVGGTTDSFGPQLRPVIGDGLGLLPWSNGVHYDSEEQRRPLFQSLIADGTLPAGYATDDGAGVSTAAPDGRGLRRARRRRRLLSNAAPTAPPSRPNSRSPACAEGGAARVAGGRVGIRRVYPPGGGRRSTRRGRRVLSSASDFVGRPTNSALAPPAGSRPRRRRGVLAPE